MSETVKLDVAIVGAGVAGTYCGFRLLDAQKAKKKSKLSVEIFELGERIGGRLLSVSPPKTNISCELGGMRYISTQTLVKSLVENKLKLRTYEFPVFEPNNIAYLRSKHLRSSQLLVSNAETMTGTMLSDEIPYALDWIERNMSASSLLGFAVNQLIPGATSMPPDQLRERLQNTSIEGRPLYKWGFWNLVARAISKEAYDLTLAISGYDTIGLNWNAVDTIGLNFGDFGPQIKYSALVDGYEGVPLGLAENFTELGGRIRMHHKLVSFDQKDDGVELVFHYQEEHEKHNNEYKHTLVVQAKQVILAMPRRSLELIAPTGKVLGNPAVQKLIKSVTPIPLFKLFVAYEYPWWEAGVGVTKGQSVTDLPIRQCYYWGKDEKSGMGVILASYDDTLNVGFWAGLQDPPQEMEPYPTDYKALSRLFGVHEDDINNNASNQHRRWREHAAPKLMVMEIQRQLAEMHNLRFIPDPIAAAYMNWGTDPFGGGVNFWNVNEKSWEVIPSMIQPVDGVPVYICGEAYSNGQGWVEGALETAEMVLKKFGLSEPDWLS